MARKRMIDPSFWEDPTIGTLSIPARLLFIGMMSHADDDGRLEVEPRYIRRAVFGFDDMSVSHVVEHLAEIRAKCRNVVFYEVDDRALACFTNWRRYQYIQKHVKSKLPPPPDDTDTVPLSEGYDTDTVPVSDNRIEKNRIERNRRENARARPPISTDPTLDHPAVEVYRAEYKTETVTLSQEQRTLIADKVTDLDLWRTTLRNWKLSGNKPSNVFGAVEWYERGGRPFPLRNGTPSANGRPPPRQVETLTRAEVEAGRARIAKQHEAPHE